MMAWAIVKRIAPGLVLALLFALVVWMAHERGVRVTTDALTTAHQAQLATMRADLATQKADAESAAREVERKHAQAMADVANDFQKANDDATREIARLDAAVRAGDVRLRDRFTCPAQPAGGGAQAGQPTPRGDAPQGGGLRQADADFLVQLSDEADAVVRQLQACQAVVRKDRGQ